MILYLIRHGQSENNELVSRTGSPEGRTPDPDLTALGRKQAFHLAKFLKACEQDPKLNEPFVSRILTSIMIRSLRTASIIGDTLGKVVEASTDIVERGGLYEGTEAQPLANPVYGYGRSYYETHFPNVLLPQDATDHGWWRGGYEPQSKAAERAGQALRRLKSLGTREDGAVAVIAHGGIIKEMLRAMPGIAGNAESFLYNGSMSRVDIEHRKIRVVYLNRIDFIPSHLITI